MNSTILKISLLAENDDSFCKTKLNGIFRVALKAISWASSVELNTTLRRGNTQVFYFKFLSRFYVFYIYLNVFFTSMLSTHARQQRDKNGCHYSMIGDQWFDDQIIDRVCWLQVVCSCNSVYDLKHLTETQCAFKNNTTVVRYIHIY